MITAKDIGDYAGLIAQQFHPEKIILFGSFAYGSPNDDSDVDLLVVMPFSGRSVEQSVAIRSAIRTPFPLDLLVRTPEFLQQRVEMGDYFIREILETGKVLYDANCQ